MKVEELRIPEDFRFPDPKGAVRHFIDMIVLAKELNDCQPLQDWLDAYDDSAESQSEAHTESVEGGDS